MQVLKETGFDVTTSDNMHLPKFKALFGAPLEGEGLLIGKVQNNGEFDWYPVIKVTDLLESMGEDESKEVGGKVSCFVAGCFPTAGREGESGSSILLLWNSRGARGGHYYASVSTCGIWGFRLCVGGCRG